MKKISFTLIYFISQQKPNILHLMRLVGMCGGEEVWAILYMCLFITFTFIFVFHPCVNGKAFFPDSGGNK